MSNGRKIKSKRIKKRQTTRALRYGVPNTIKLIRGSKRPRMAPPPDYDFLFLSGRPLL